MFKYSVSNWIYGDEKLEDTMKRLSKFGFDGVELMGEPDFYDPGEVNSLCEKYGLGVLSIAGIYTKGRDLSHPDESERKSAKDYLKKCIDFAVKVKTDVIIVVPTEVGRTKPCEDLSKWLDESKRQFDFAVESLKEVAPYAESKGVFLAIEPINRYETFLINTAEEAMKLCEAVGSPAMKIHLDTFHMNIEEKNFYDPFIMVKDLLVNIHIADSNRQAVGYGHTDFRSMVKALKEINYQRALALEPLPPVPNPYLAVKLGLYRELWDEYAKVSIERLKKLEEEV